MAANTIQTQKKVAVVAGCNYHNNPDIALSGCIHDARLMQKTLIERFGFEPNNIELLTDDQKKTPTRPNIYGSLDRMVREAKPGDLLVFCFSGHGTIIPSTHSPTKKDEQAIVTYDTNFITSIDFRMLVEKVAKGAIFTIMADSCNSGGLIDKEKEQIGPHHKSPSDRARMVITQTAGLSRRRMVPFERVLSHLTSASRLNVDHSSADNIMLQVFGPDRLPKPLGPEQGILLTGCQADEYSEEGIIDGAVSGYFTYALNEALKEHRGPLTNKELVVRVREIMKAMNNNAQHPCLYCSDKNVNDVFLLT